MNPIEKDLKIVEEYISSQLFRFERTDALDALNRLKSMLPEWDVKSQSNQELAEKIDQLASYYRTDAYQTSQAFIDAVQSLLDNHIVESNKKVSVDEIMDKVDRKAHNEKYIQYGDGLQIMGKGYRKVIKLTELETILREVLK